MFANFVCKNCGNKIIFDSSHYSKFPNHCSKCGLGIINLQYINAFFDSCLSLERSLEQLDFCGLSVNNPSEVYEADLDNLNTLYSSASPAVKRLLVEILDKNFLMVYDKARNEDLEGLQEYKDALHSLWAKGLNLEREQLLKLLGVEEE